MALTVVDISLLSRARRQNALPLRLLRATLYALGIIFLILTVIAANAFIHYVPQLGSTKPVDPSMSEFYGNILIALLGASSIVAAALAIRGWMSAIALLLAVFGCAFAVDLIVFVGHLSNGLVVYDLGTLSAPDARNRIDLSADRRAIAVTLYGLLCNLVIFRLLLRLGRPLLFRKYRPLLAFRSHLFSSGTDLALIKPLVLQYGWRLLTNGRFILGSLFYILYILLLWIALFIPLFLASSYVRFGIVVGAVKVFPQTEFYYLRIFVLETMMLIAGLVASRFIFFFSNICRIASDRSAVLSAERLRKIDKRPPVLYLRSFRNDRLRARDPREWGIARLVDPYRDKSTMEQLISRRSFTLGPIVTIADPKATMQPAGAARAFVQGADWKEVVQSLMREASLIVVLMDLTENLKWEIEQIVTPDLLSKTLFVFPPLPSKAALTGGLSTIELLRAVLPPDAWSELAGADLVTTVRAIRCTPIATRAVVSQTATISDFELAFDILTRDAI